MTCSIYLNNIRLYPDKCHLPELTNVVVEGEGDSDGDSWVGSFSCESGSILVGETRVKCRHGVWSGALPVCAGNTYDVGLQGRSHSQYVYKICLEFLLIQEVIFIVLIVIPADPPSAPLSRISGNVRCKGPVFTSL